jgi:hypothetical protein
VRGGDGAAVFVFGKVASDAEGGGKYAAWLMDAGAARWGRATGVQRVCFLGRGRTSLVQASAPT